MVYSVCSWCYSFHKFSLNMINMINMSLKNTKKRDLKIFISCLKRHLFHVFFRFGCDTSEAMGVIMAWCRSHSADAGHLDISACFACFAWGIVAYFSIFNHWKYMKFHEISMLRIQDGGSMWFQSRSVLWLWQLSERNVCAENAGLTESMSSPVGEKPITIQAGYG